MLLPDVAWVDYMRLIHWVPDLSVVCALDQTLLGEGLLHLADSPPESSPNHPFQCQRIPHRIPAAVVVKVHEHVSAHALPLPHAVRPPAQIVLAIGARVKMMMVGPRETSPIQKKIGPPRA